MKILEEISLFEKRAKIHLKNIRALKQQLDKKGATGGLKVTTLKKEILEQKIKLERNRAKIAHRKQEIMENEIRRLEHDKPVALSKKSNKKSKASKKPKADESLSESDLKKLIEIQRKIEVLNKERTSCIQSKLVATERMYVFGYELKHNKTLPMAGTFLYRQGSTLLYPYYSVRNRRMYRPVAAAGGQHCEGDVVLSANKALAFSIKKIPGDGDCGYRALGMTRKAAFKSILKKLDLEDDTMLKKIKNLLSPAIIEQLLSNVFLDFLREMDVDTAEISQLQSELKKNNTPGDVDIINEKLKKFARKKRIVRGYLKYDIGQKKISDGWAHASVLQVIALVNHFNLNIWTLSSGQCVPLNRYHQLDTSYEKTVDIIYSNGNHFDGLERFDPGQKEKRSRVQPQLSSVYPDRHRNNLSRQFHGEEAMVEDTIVIETPQKLSKAEVTTAVKKVDQTVAGKLTASTEGSLVIDKSHVQKHTVRSTQSSNKTSVSSRATPIAASKKDVNVVSGKNGRTLLQDNNNKKRFVDTKLDKAMEKSGIRVPNIKIQARRTIIRAGADNEYVSVDTSLDEVIDARAGYGRSANVKVRNKSDAIPDVTGTISLLSNGKKTTAVIGATIGEEILLELGAPGNLLYCRVNGPSGELRAAGTIDGIESSYELSRVIKAGSAKCTATMPPFATPFGFITPGLTFEVETFVGYGFGAKKETCEAQNGNIKTTLAVERSHPLFPIGLGGAIGIILPQEYGDALNDISVNDPQSAPDLAMLREYTGEPDSLANEVSAQARLFSNNCNNDSQNTNQPDIAHWFTQEYAESQLNDYISDYSKSNDKQTNIESSVGDLLANSVFSQNQSAVSFGASSSDRSTWGNDGVSHSDRYRVGPTQERADYLSSDSYRPGPFVENAKWGVG